jgi:hypothetical protein
MVAVASRVVNLSKRAGEKASGFGLQASGGQTMARYGELTRGFQRTLDALRPEARSLKPEARSLKPEARSLKPEACSDLRTGSLETGMPVAVVPPVWYFSSSRAADQPPRAI